MVQPTRKSTIVTFKPKNQRPAKTKDKLEVFFAEITSEVKFFDAGTMIPGATPPAGLPSEMIGYDVNQYETPLVIASLTEREIDALRKNANVVAVEDDGPYHVLEQGPSQLSASFAMEGQPSPQAETIPTGVAQVKAPAAWDCSQGKAIKVAVLDTGIDGTHPDLVASYRGGISFVPGESSAMDFNGSGTHLAGTITAAINGAGVVGVAPAASLYAVKVLSNSGSGQWSWLIAGIAWCITNGIKILNICVGGLSAPTALEAMCNMAWSKGLLLVTGAGHSGPGMGTVGVPAKYASVIAVSAIDSSNLVAGFSSRGSEVELCSPGVNILSTVPGGGYRTMSGSGRACSHVSGVAALTWGSHRYADNVTIRRLLAWTADNLGTPGRDPLYGYGRVDAERAACELTVPPAIPGIP
jgi:subtilisin